MEILIIFFPLLGSFFSLFFGKFLGNFYACFLTIFLIVMSLFFSVYLFFIIGFFHNNIVIDFLSWFFVYNLKINWLFLFDSLTAIMLIVVLFISLCVHIYSMEYMKGDPHIIRFFSYLSLFTFFMLMLITAGNFIQLFLGWEGVGVCSYLLINFWFTRKQANKSAIKAMIVNRIGDLGLLLGIFFIYWFFNSLDFFVVFSLISFVNFEFNNFCGISFSLLNIISFFLFVGAMGKSAQVGLHVWLPDAMEGPTPVSALIHAATMVTAGIFLIIRCSPIFEYSSFVLSFITVVGSLTAFFAATVGLLQNDIKKVIAYSTCSQLGYMVFCCGLSSYNVALFHLYNHAFFKALLFLGAGSIIHAISNEQDMRLFGGLIKLLPFTYIVMLIGSLSLIGFPFLTGFYSKDVILELAASSFTFVGVFCYWLGVISVFFTAFYSFRLLYLTFWSSPKNFYKNYEFLGNHESLNYIFFSLFILCVLSIFIGYLSKDFFIGFGTDFFENSLKILPSHNLQIFSEFLPIYIKLLPFFFSLMGMCLSLILHFFYYYYQINLNLNSLGNYLYKLVNQRWFFDIIFNYFFVKKGLIFGYKVCFKLIDKGFIEFFGPTGLSKIFYNLSNNYIIIHSGYIYHYIFIMIGSSVIFIFLLTGFFSFFYIKLFIINIYFIFFLKHINRKFFFI